MAQSEIKTNKQSAMDGDNDFEIPKDYNIFSKSEDDSDVDMISHLFDQPMDQVEESVSKVEAETKLNTESKPDDGSLKTDSNKKLGDVFSDALGAVSSLDDQESTEELNLTKKKDKTKKQSIWQRLFHNVKKELTEEEREALKQQAVLEVEEKEKKKQENLEKKKQAKANKAAAKEAAKKAAAEAAKQKKIKKAKLKQDEQDKKTREIQELIDEIDENEGKINKVGAGIVFGLFAILAIVIVVGTNVYSYQMHVKYAKENFDFRRYNEAYEEISGLNIKDEDTLIHDKIMTVMFVNQQLNSYHTYYEMGEYPKALDSLLKGLKRYDKYYGAAKELKIQSDLDYVRSLIIKELDESFDVSESEAKNLIAISDRNHYSGSVFAVAANVNDKKQNK